MGGGVRGGGGGGGAWVGPGVEAGWVAIGARIQLDRLRGSGRYRSVADGDELSDVYRKEQSIRSVMKQAAHSA